MDLFQTFVDNILTPLYQLSVGIALVYFLGAAAYFMFQMDKEDAREKSRQHLLWGGIGLFIVFSIGGIMKLFENIFGGIFNL